MTSFAGPWQSGRVLYDSTAWRGMARAAAGARMIRLVLGMRKMDRSLDQPSFSRYRVPLSDFDDDRLAANPDINDSAGNNPIGANPISAAVFDDLLAGLMPVRLKPATGRSPTLRDAATR